MFFIKVKKHVFNVFYLQINVFNIYDYNIMGGLLHPEQQKGAWVGCD